MKKKQIENNIIKKENLLDHIKVGDLIEYNIRMNGKYYTVIENITTVTTQYVATYRKLWSKEDIHEDILGVYKRNGINYECFWKVN